MKHLPFIILLCFISCATMQSVPSDIRTKTIHANYNKTFGATLQLITEKGFVIKNADKETGFINTDYRQSSTTQSMLTGKQRAKINALMREVDSENTKLTLTLVSEEQSGFGWKASNLSGGKAKEIYDKFFNGIKQIAKN